METIGIFGGSFSPAHFGHYTIVQQILQQGFVDRVLIIPTYQNPLKDSSSRLSTSLRIQILEATFEDLNQVEISHYELNQKKVTYTYETLAHLRCQYPKSHFKLVLGEDVYSNMLQWAFPEKIFQMAQLLLVQRPAQVREGGSYSWEKQFDVQQEKVSFSVPDISSTQIRKMSLATLLQKNWLYPKALPYWKHYLQLKSRKTLFTD